MKIDIKSAVKHDVIFNYYREGVLYYNTHDNIMFAVPVEDIGNATLNSSEKGLMMMRYMRKHNNILNEGEENENNLQ